MNSVEQHGEPPVVLIIGNETLQSRTLGHQIQQLCSNKAGNAETTNPSGIVAATTVTANTVSVIDLNPRQRTAKWGARRGIAAVPAGAQNCPQGIRQKLAVGPSGRMLSNAV